MTTVNATMACHCGRKSRFTDKGTAKRWARQKTAEFGVKTSVYHCAVCGAYHLTTKRAKRNNNGGT